MTRSFEPKMLRVLTYNVHRWLGIDRRVAPGRVADVIASCNPDVVALQEVRIGRARMDGVDQATAVARRLGMEFHFHPTVRFMGEQFGIAMLSRKPSRFVKVGLLPGLRRGPRLEPRAAMWLAVEVDGREVQVINTHLGLLPSERREQAEFLLGPDWLGHPACEGPTVLLGDLNARPNSGAYNLLCHRLEDAQLADPTRAPRPTFHTRLPLTRIDHVLVNHGFEVLGVETPRCALSRKASDHLPLAVDLRIVQPSQRRARARLAATG